MINVDEEFPIGGRNNEVFLNEISLILNNVFNQYGQIYSYIRMNNDIFESKRISYAQKIKLKYLVYKLN